MFEEEETADPGKTRRFLSNSLKGFRANTDPGNRLRNLWKISQLAERITGEELYESASATVVEEDYRPGAEICHTISHSERIQLMQFLREMTQDENPHVRRAAITVLGNLSRAREATLIAIEPILGEMDRLRSAVMNLEDEVILLRDSIEKLANASAASPPAGEVIMDDYIKCWETYLRHENELFREHEGEYVAIYRGEIIGIGEDEESLAEMIHEEYGSVEALICKIEEEDEPIRMPPPRAIIR